MAMRVAPLVKMDKDHCTPEREGFEPSDHTGLNSTNLINLTSYTPKIGLLECFSYF